jgi:hypothetical protein
LLRSDGHAKNPTDLILHSLISKYVGVSSSYLLITYAVSSSITYGTIPNGLIYVSPLPAA